MPLFKASNVLFIHIPKTAGTSVEKQLYNLEDPYYRWTVESFFSWNYDHKTIDHNGRAYSFQYYTFGDFEEVLGQEKLNSFKMIFTIVRNPYEKLVSEFYYYCMIKKTIINTENLSDLQQQFEVFCRQLISGQIKDDNYQLSQYEYLKNHNGIVDQRIKILRYETLVKDLKEYLNLDLHYHELESNRTFKYKDHYNAICQQLVADHYALDFKTFGYDPTQLS
jgi:hypothetical protein